MSLRTINDNYRNALNEARSKPLPTEQDLRARIDANTDLTSSEATELKKLAIDAASSFEGVAAFEVRFQQLSANDVFSATGAQGATIKKTYEDTLAAAEAKLAEGGPNKAKLAQEIAKLKSLYASITADGVISNTAANRELSVFNGQINAVNTASGTLTQNNTLVQNATAARDAAQVSFDNPTLTNKAALKELLAQINPLLDKINSGGTLSALDRSKLTALTRALTENTQTATYTNSRIGDLMNTLGQARIAGTIDQVEFEALAKQISKITSYGWNAESAGLLNRHLDGWEREINLRIASGPVVPPSAPATAPTANAPTGSSAPDAP